MSKLTREDVLNIVGHGLLDDHTIAELIATQATPPELTEAIERTALGEDTLGAETLRAASPKVHQLCEILAESTVDWTEWEERE
jgi:hypothetical protein